MHILSIQTMVKHLNFVSNYNFIHTVTINKIFFIFIQEINAILSSDKPKLVVKKVLFFYNFL